MTFGECERNGVGSPFRPGDFEMNKYFDRKELATRFTRQPST